MTRDNSDLLGGNAPAAPRRRPRNPPPAEAIQAAPPATPSVVLGSTKPETALPQIAPAALLDVFQASSEAPIADTVGDGFTGFRPSEAPAIPEDPHAYELPPVSTEYAAAQARKPIIIGQTSRDYAYKRVLRAGKRL